MSNTFDILSNIFNEPVEKPEFENKKDFGLLPAGQYMGKIEQIELKKSSKGNEYYNIRFSLQDMAGNKKGSLFDMLMLTDTPLNRFKLKTFVDACGITGPLEEEYFKKMAQGKELIVEVTTQKGTNGYADKNVVNVFANKPFISLNDPMFDDVEDIADQIEEVFGVKPEIETADEGEY